MKKFKIILTREVEVSIECHSKISAQSKAQELLKIFGYDTYTVIEDKKVEMNPVFESLFSSLLK